jgi:hypothetical protein
MGTPHDRRTSDLCTDQPLERIRAPSDERVSPCASSLARADWHFVVGAVLVASLCWALFPSVCPLPLLAAQTETVGPAAQPAAEDTRAMPPAAAALKESVQLARDVYKDDFTKARKPEEKTQWAHKLSELGTQEKDLAARFALFSLARDTAAEAGDFGTACGAVDGLGTTFRVDVLQLKAEAATTIAKSLRTAEARKGFVAQLQPVIEEALDVERHDVARPLADLALSVSRAGTDAALVRQATAGVVKVRETEAAYAEFGKAQAVLAKNPMDPDANLAAGRFQCFVKGNWPVGLPLLARGSDLSLKSAAESDLAAPQSADGQAKLGDVWWDCAEKLGGPARAAARHRAGTWYRQAVPSMDKGLARAKVEHRLKETDPAPPEAPAVAVTPDNPVAVAPASLPANNKAANQALLADAKRVLARGTAPEQDDVAKKLLAEAARGTDAAYSEFLLDKAVELASRNAENLQTALTALQQLSDAVPDREPECRDRILSLCQSRMSTCAPADRQAVAAVWKGELLKATDVEVQRERYGKAAALVQRAMEVFKSQPSPEADALAAKLVELKSKDAEQKKRAEAVRLLQGEQEQDSLVLYPRAKPYIVRGNYTVPPRKVLEVRDGCVVHVEGGGQLIVNGSLRVRGLPASPVYFRGASANVGSWKGIKIKESASSELRYAWVGGALVAVETEKCSPKFYGCVLADNQKGLMDSNGHPEFEECVIAYNQGDGLYTRAGGFTFTRSTVSHNGGCGVSGSYDVHCSMQRTLVTQNGNGGVRIWQYDCNLDAKDCYIGGNHGFDVNNECDKDWDLAGNWWGPEATKLLKAKGANVRLPNIIDGHETEKRHMVWVAGWLEQMPEPCGARLSKIGDKSVR